MRSAFLLVVELAASLGFGQLPSAQCDVMGNTLRDCTSLTPVRWSQSLIESRGLFEQDSQATSNSLSGNGSSVSAGLLTQRPPAKQGFHWGRALFESFVFFSIEQAYVVREDYRWVTVENGVPFNHYWRDYTQSLSAWVHSGWNDGDPHWYGYVGHPIQGALTSFIQIQNDPAGEKLEQSTSKEYWKSRLKATLWNAVYSTQWNLGPLSEVTIEKYGTHIRPPWNQDGSWPCKTHCLSGVGQIDIVMTPLGGMGWMLGEDFLDKRLVRRVEAATSNRFLIDTVRCGLNPIRGGANMLHGKWPWYRASRDVPRLVLYNENKTATPKDRGAAASH